MQGLFVLSVLLAQRAMRVYTFSVRILTEGTYGPRQSERKGSV